MAARRGGAEGRDVDTLRTSSSLLLGSERERGEKKEQTYSWEPATSSKGEEREEGGGVLITIPGRGFVKRAIERGGKGKIEGNRPYLQRHSVAARAKKSLPKKVRAIKSMVAVHAEKKKLPRKGSK